MSWNFQWGLAACFLGLMNAWALAQAAPAIQTPHIKVDQLGYLTTSTKVAVVVNPQLGQNAGTPFQPATGAGQYQLRRWADDGVVYSGTLVAWGQGATHAQSGDQGWWFDFSSVTTPGQYYVFDTLNQVGSHRITLGASGYQAALRHAGRALFYQRLNHAKQPPYADSRWSDAAAYDGPGQDRQARDVTAKIDVSTARDLHGGWADAGDTNKYVTFSRAPVLQLLEAWRLNPGAFTDQWGIPESGNGVPDVLDELKWQLDFITRMQDATGTQGLLLKVGLDTYSGDSTPPSTDTRPRYYVGECTSSTLAGSAMLAAGAVVYRNINSLSAYGQNLLDRARAALARAQVTTQQLTRFDTQCDDGSVKAGDADEDAATQKASAVIAAVYLFEATGSSEYRNLVDALYTSVGPLQNGWWGPYEADLEMALLRYTRLAGASVAVVNDILGRKAASNVFSLADADAQSDLYRAYLADPQYHWGHNIVRANTGSSNLNFKTFGLNPAQAARYQALAEEHLHWLHGANPLGLVMLSQMADAGATRSVSEIYHTWFADGSIWDSALTSARGPAPGFMTGGPNKSYSGSATHIANQPPQKAYRDWNTPADSAWELTEPSISGQAAYIALLSRVLAGEAAPVQDTQPPTAPTGLRVSQLTAASLQLNWNAASDNVGVVGYDVRVNGQLRATGVAGLGAALSGLVCGQVYSMTVVARDAVGLVSVPSDALSVATPACPVAGTSLYTDALASGWQDWSWGSSRNYGATSPVKVGSKSLKVAYSAWGGLVLRHDSGVALSPSSRLSFWAYANAATLLTVYATPTDSGSPTAQVPVTLPSRTWVQVELPVGQLGLSNQLKRLTLQLEANRSLTVFFDEIQVLP